MIIITIAKGKKQENTTLIEELYQKNGSQACLMTNFNITDEVSKCDH